MLPISPPRPPGPKASRGAPVVIETMARRPGNSRDHGACGPHGGHHFSDQRLNMHANREMIIAVQGRRYGRRSQGPDQ